MNTQDIKAARQTRVKAAMQSIENLLGEAAPDRQTLEAISGKLQELAGHPELFPAEDFPPPSPDTGASSSRYLLGQEKDRYALYINVMNPGKNTKPHNHGTWAVIAALRGEELNRIYHRTDDGSNPEHAELEQIREYVVKPGSPITFLPTDIHSIHVGGTQTVMHLHLYGRELETLTGRLGFDLETGQIYNYNKTFMRPTVGRDV